MKVDGVPEGVSRQRCINLVEALGFDSRLVVSLRFTPQHVFAEVKFQQDGRDVLDDTETKVLTHTVVVPYLDPDPDRVPLAHVATNRELEPDLLMPYVNALADCSLGTPGG